MTVRIQSSTAPVSALAPAKTAVPGQFASALAVSTPAVATPVASTSNYVNTLTLAQQKAVSSAATATPSASTSPSSSTDDQAAMTTLVEQQIEVVSSTCSRLAPAAPLDTD